MLKHTSINSALPHRATHAEAPNGHPQAKKSATAPCHGDERLSDNFTLRELTASATARRLGLPNEPAGEALACLRLLCQRLLQPARTLWGMPIAVTSGYRCPALNRAVGGAQRSQHMRGQAADIVAAAHAAGESRRQANLRLARKVADRLDFDQLIVERGGQWLHLSYVSPQANRHAVMGLQPRRQRHGQ